METQEKNHALKFLGISGNSGPEQGGENLGDLTTEDTECTETEEEGWPEWQTETLGRSR